MRRSLLRAGLCALALAAAASAAAAAPEPVRVILVGDSTMATKSGYGDALCARFTAAVSCLNQARGGRSSYSFRAEGLWDRVMAMLRQPGAGKTYVLIQFGHNDQPGKPGRSTDLVTGFTPNMARYVREVLDAGGQPVLVTPLTRRTFKEGALQNDLRPWAEVTLETARAAQVPVLDLNAESFTAVQMLGQDQADSFAVIPRPENWTPESNAIAERQGQPKSAFDRTHLGAKGADFFARMVLREFQLAVPAIAPYIKAEP